MQPAQYRFIAFAEQLTVPWRNGGGVTREVAVGCGDVAGAGFRWRVSVARVASDGPFSLFTGIDRTIWLLRGAGMVLQLQGVEHRLDARLAPFRFRGEDHVEARLIEGPTEDLNVMVERRTTSATSRVLTLARHSELPIHSRDQDECVMLVLAGAVQFATSTSQLRLAEGDAMSWKGGGAVQVTSTDRERTDLLWCSFTARGEPD